MYGHPEFLNKNHPKLLDVDQLAEALSVDKSWIYSRTRTDEIPHYKIGKYRRFDLDEVLAWLKK